MATKLDIKKIYTPLYYGTNKWVERGCLYKVKESQFNPEYIVFHPEDFAMVNEALPLRILKPLSEWHADLRRMIFHPEISNG
jgi:hypothetical protein